MTYPYPAYSPNSLPQPAYFDRRYPYGLYRPSFSPPYPMGNGAPSFSPQTVSLPFNKTQSNISSPSNQSNTLSNGQLAVLGTGLVSVIGGLAFWLTRPQKENNDKAASNKSSPTTSGKSLSSSDTPAIENSKTPDTNKAHIQAHKIIHVPADFKDPLYCEQVAYKIADASFTKTLDCLQNEEPDAWTCFHKLENPLREAVQNHLGSDYTADFQFFINPFKPNYAASTSKMADRPDQRLRVSSITLQGNIPRTPEQIQKFYGTYCHEIRHMVQDFAHGPDVQREKHLSKPGEPYHKEYDKLVKPYYNRQWAQVYLKLAKDYPECQELDDLFVKQDVEAPLSEEQFTRFLNGMNKLWERPGYPAIEEHKRFPIWKELFQKGDPKVVDYLVNHEVLLELEGYGTFMKRAPHSSKVGYGNDLADAAHFVFLRDLLRLYYDERKVPLAERHPYTQPEYAIAHPLKLFKWGYRRCSEVLVHSHSKP